MRLLCSRLPATISRESFPWSSLLKMLVEASLVCHQRASEELLWNPSGKLITTICCTACSALCGKVRNWCCGSQINVERCTSRDWYMPGTTPTIMIPVVMSGIMFTCALHVLTH